VAHLHTVAIVQGRMSSSRLPGKVLLDITGETMLARVLRRTHRAHSLDLITVATTVDSSDDRVANWCRENNTPYFRGDMFDVLDRFYQAARQFSADIIVRITADCPVIDPQLIDQTTALIIDKSKANKDLCDFACNRLPPPWRRTYPIGLDVEVCTFPALEQAWKEASEKHQREHVMPYLYEGVQFEAQKKQPSEETTYITRGMSSRGFRIAQLHHNPDHGSLRWTVDTPEDLELMRRVFTHFGCDDFSWQDILALQQDQPEMFTVNIGVTHKTAFDVDERLNKD
jgi:spore coat polysaccharide biosynthesis protein SpsF